MQTQNPGHPAGQASEVFNTSGLPSEEDFVPVALERSQLENLGERTTFTNSR